MPCKVTKEKRFPTLSQKPFIINEILKQVQNDDKHCLS